MNMQIKGLRFTKMHGLGNDFIVIDGINQKVALNKEKIRTLANRHTGIGFDQCLLIEAPKEKEVDFTYRIFNSNGQEVGQCGNGARCLALFLNHYQLTSKTVITVATSSTQMQLKINEDASVSIDMGQAKFEPTEIPLLASKQQISYPFVTDKGERFELHALSVGNPHAVLQVENIDTAPVEILGRAISEHEMFPEQANVSFMQMVSDHQIRLRVYERGCGETSACGSGAAAAAVIARRYYGALNPVKISLPGGELTVDWQEKNDSLILTGPADFVFEGHLM